MAKQLFRVPLFILPKLYPPYLCKYYQCYTRYTINAGDTPFSDDIASYTILYIERMLQITPHQFLYF